MPGHILGLGGDFVLLLSDDFQTFSAINCQTSMQPINSAADCNRENAQ